MESEYYSEATLTPPKLSLFSSFPLMKPNDPPGTLTPPINSPVSIPFLWEEAPGRPRPCAAQSKPTEETEGNFATAIARCLELPPRLLSEDSYCRVSSILSPTTVLEGPDSGRPATRALSFRREGSFRGRQQESRLSRRVLFGSGRWGSFRKSNNGGDEVASGGSLDFQSWVRAGSGSGGGGDTRVKMTRIRRRGSLLSLSHGGSSVLANIYEGLKQVVQWRRGQEKIRKKSF